MMSLCLLFLLPGLPLRGQERTYHFRHVAHALDLGRILRGGVLSDSSGFVWFSAGETLYRFDGTDQFDSFALKPEQQDERRVNLINDNAIAPDGTIWLATRRGLARYVPGTFAIELIAPLAPPEHRQILQGRMPSLCVDAEGRVWFSSGYTIYRYTPKSKELKSILTTTSKSGPARFIRFDKKGVLWTMFFRGVVGRKEPNSDAFTLYDLNDFSGPKPNRLVFLSGLLLGNDHLLFSSRAGLFLVDLSRRTLHEILRGEQSESFAGRYAARALAVENEKQTIWVGTRDRGLFFADLYGPPAVRIASGSGTSKGILSPQVHSLSRDANGDLWIGTTRGFSILNDARDFSFIPYEKIGGKPFDVGLAGMAFDTRGRRWIATPNSPMLVTDLKTGKTRQVKYLTDRKISSPRRQTLVPGDDGDMWVSAHGYGLIHISGDLKTVETFRQENPPRGYFINSICRDRNGDIIVAHEDGLSRFNCGTRTFTTIKVPQHERRPLYGVDYNIRHVTRVPRGIVFSTAFTDIVYFLEDGKETPQILDIKYHCKVRAGAPPISSLRPWGADEVLITNIRGLVTFNLVTGRSVSWPDPEGDGPSARNGMLIDASGHFWVASTSGLLYDIDPVSLLVRTAEPRESTGAYAFIPGQHQVAPSGKLCFLTREGLLQFDAATVKLSHPSRPPQITRVDVKGETVWLGGYKKASHGISLRDTKDLVSIYFVAPKSAHDGDISYEYRLSEVRPEWTAIGNRRCVNFSSLPPGDLVFQVRATSKRLGTQTISEPFTLAVTLPFLKRPVVHASLALLIAAVLILAAFTRVHRARSQNERLRLEIQRRAEAEAALAESEAKLATAFANIPCATWVRDRNGMVVMASPRFVEAWGDALGSCDPTERMPAVHAKRWKSDHHRAMMGHAIQETLDYRDRNNDYRVIHVVAPVEVEGEVVGSIGMDVDVSALRRSEQEKAELERQLRHTQKLEAVGKLAGGVAHDFNNILTAISGHAEMLKAGLQDGTEPSVLRADADGILSSSSRAARLTQQLLTFSKKDLVIPETFHPCPLLDDMKAMLLRLLRENIRFEVTCDPNAGAIHADKGQFEQILLNLVVNASDAMPQGGDLNLTLDAAVLKDAAGESVPALKIRVEDNGEGMSEDVLQRVFEPYFTTKAVGEGTGLGLSTVHGIVERLGGTIHIESTPHVGTTVTVVLPAVHPVPTKNPGTFPQPAAGEPLSGSETILICEDNREVLSLAGRILRMAGYNTVEVSSPEQAIAVFHEMTPAPKLLLTDVIMPVMDGPKLAAALQASRPNLKVLFMSGYTADVMRDTDHTLRETAYLRKPFSAQSLTRQIRQLLDRDTDRVHRI